MTEKAHVHRVKNIEGLKGLVGKVVIYNSPSICHEDFLNNALYLGQTRKGKSKHMFLTRGEGGQILVSLPDDREINFYSETGALLDQGDLHVSYSQEDPAYHVLDKILLGVGL